MEAKTKIDINDPKLPYYHAAPILKHFRYKHLPPDLMIVSRDFCKLAHTIAQGYFRKNGTYDPEIAVCLRKLLEAKNAVIRVHTSRSMGSHCEDEILAMTDDILAMQSQESLGSREENDRAEKRMWALQQKRDELEKEMKMNIKSNKKFDSFLEGRNKKITDIRWLCGPPRKLSVCEPPKKITHIYQVASQMAQIVVIWNFRSLPNSGRGSSSAVVVESKKTGDLTGFAGYEPVDIAALATNNGIFAKYLW